MGSLSAALAIALIEASASACGGRIDETCRPAESCYSPDAPSDTSLRPSPRDASTDSDTGGALIPDAPVVVGSITECAGTDNILFVNGDPGDPIHPGPLTIRGSLDWTAESITSATALIGYMSRTDSTMSWGLEVSTKQLGRRLTPGVYERVEAAGYEFPGFAGLRVESGAVPCGALSGRFQLHVIDNDEVFVHRLLISFEQHCGSIGPALRGCLRYSDYGW